LRELEKAKQKNGYVKARKNIDAIHVESHCLSMELKENVTTAEKTFQNGSFKKRVVKQRIYLAIWLGNSTTLQ